MKKVAAKGQKEAPIARSLKIGYPWRLKSYQGYPIFERMLTMERIQYITGLREFEGLSLRAIGERTGHHFDTIKKYAEREDWNEEIKPRKQRESKLDPLKPVIDKWLEEDLKMPRKQRHTGTQIYDRLSNEPEFGCF